ncbi:hypothetical protein F383_23909 [Gossypium arboreum]|uniref:Uncharacterized protein n=1 Tax=Gossypium arboreum TaxID=29729 RepID=A0A0B0P2X9_GOSAR|nr:hypothetical protein F383_23909 [Gossypium arboreum]
MVVWHKSVYPTGLAWPSTRACVAIFKAHGLSTRACVLACDPSQRVTRG